MGGGKGTNGEKSSEALGQVVLESVAGGGASRGHLKFAIDRGQVPVNGTRADDELLGNLSVGESLCDETQYFHLTGGQSCRVGGMKCGSGRSGHQCCMGLLRDLWRECLMRGERLCGGHGAPSCPGLFKDLLAQLPANYDHHAVIECWLNGHAAGLAQGLCRSPEHGCPG